MGGVGVGDVAGWRGVGGGGWRVEGVPLSFYKTADGSKVTVSRRVLQVREEEKKEKGGGKKKKKKKTRARGSFIDLSASAVESQTVPHTYFISPANAQLQQRENSLSSKRRGLGKFGTCVIVVCCCGLFLA